MSERRSGRSRKQVDYAKFEADIDNDDDFADPTPPPPKKKKTSEKTDRNKEKEKPPKVTPSDRPAGRKARLPLEDKLYERDLQAALEMSLQASQSGQNVDDDNTRVTSTINGDVILHSTPMVDSHHDMAKTEMPIEPQSIMLSAIPHSVATSDDIEFLGKVSCSDTDSPYSKSKRCAATRKRKTYNLDEDESADNEDYSDGASESDSDYSDADSDFDDSKVKGKSKSKAKIKGKAAPAKTKPTPAAERNRQTSSKPDSKAVSLRQTHNVAPRPFTTIESKAAASVEKTTSVARVKPSAPSTVTSSKVSSVRHKPPAWTPPGYSDSNYSSSSGSSLKSPSSGLRLGLSRHARIKPLHPSLKVSLLSPS